MADDSIKGTEFKLNVRMEPIDGKYHLSNIDCLLARWAARLRSSRRSRRGR